MNTRQNIMRHPDHPVLFCLTRIGGALMAMAILLVVWGCEDRDVDTGISITPATAQLTNGIRTVLQLTAEANESGNLYMPLTWTVEDPLLGSIISASGATAVYRSSGWPGSNVITVRDDSDSKGEAVIVVRGIEDPGITVDPVHSRITNTTTATAVLLTASPAEGDQLTLPLVWFVSNPEGGDIVSSAGLTAVYESVPRMIGNNVITVYDQLGRSGQAIIEQARE